MDPVRRWSLRRARRARAIGVLAGVAAIVAPVAAVGESAPTAPPAAAGPTGPTGVTGPTAPISLQTLVQRSLSLPVRDETITTYGQGPSLVVGSPSDSFSATVRVGASPSDEQIAAHGGKTAVAIRLVGGVLYLHGPGFGVGHDGSVWLSMPFGEYERLSHGTSVLLWASTYSGFITRGLATMARLASGMSDVGASTVEGQPVTEFKGTISVAALFGIAVPKQGVAPRFELALFVAPTGRLLRADLGYPGLSEITATVTSTGPVTVTRPPARDTIAFATLSPASRKRFLNGSS